MNFKDYNHLKIALLMLLFLMICLPIFTSCQRGELVIDPESEALGYKIFKGTTKGFRISFEYPNTWGRNTVDRGGTYNYMPLSPLNSRVIIVSDKTGDSNADEILDSIIDGESKNTEFQIIIRSKIVLGKTEGEEVNYSYRFGVEDPHRPLVYAEPGDKVIGRILSVNHNDYNYNLFLLAAISNYEDANRGFEHIIQTFKFLD
ncbi:MAG: hypothetical protein A2144_07305 [Chloroflexi bacterium RBG_16_50_9]|nr:MAG: hypothetical protein A2144_07305 [Chloroflexi bacterium RBG_16_50_9]